MTVINKFMDCDLITLDNLCWWWNPSCDHWRLNLKYARNVLRILCVEKCLKRTDGKTVYYKKTEIFIEILQELQYAEQLLNSCGVETYVEYLIGDIGGMFGRIGMIKLWYQMLETIEPFPESYNFANKMKLEGIRLI